MKAVLKEKQKTNREQMLYLPHDTLRCAGGRRSGWVGLLVFLGLRLQPFPLLFLRLLLDEPATGEEKSENIWETFRTNSKTTSFNMFH